MQVNKKYLLSITSKSEDVDCLISELVYPLNVTSNLLQLITEHMYLEEIIKSSKSDSEIGKRIYSKLNTLQKPKGGQDQFKIVNLRKNSPYNVDLLISAAPYAIVILELIIAENSNDLEKHLFELFRNMPINLRKKRCKILAKRLILGMRLTLSLVSIKINNYN